MAAYITVDLGFGDSAKGATIDYLSHKYPENVVIRYSGGSQAAHNVVQPDGRHHTFHQIGSGSFVATSKTFLSKYMLINPTSFLDEIKALQDVSVDVAGRVFVSEDAQVILPWYATATKVREILRGNKVHGSTGEGVGEARRDALSQKQVLHVKDLLSDNLYDMLETLFDNKEKELVSIIKSHKMDNTTQEDLYDLFQTSFLYEELPLLLNDMKTFLSKVTVVNDLYLKELSKTNTLLFEAAQGVLLDEYYGFHPYNTWTNTTSHNAAELLKLIDYKESVHTYGLIRAYQTRHGAGPMPSELTHMSKDIIELHNGADKWTGEFRKGLLDLVLINYALTINPVDTLVVSNLDEVSDYKSVIAYNGEHLTVAEFDLDLRNTTVLENIEEYIIEQSQDEKSYLKHISEYLNVPIGITANGLTHQHRMERK